MLVRNISRCWLKISGSFRITPRHYILREKLSGWALLEGPDMYIRRSWSVLLSHPAVRYPNVKCRRRPCYPEQLHPDSPRGHVVRSPIRTPSGRSTRHSRTTHPAMLPCYVIPPACHSPRSAALRWCVRTPCPDIFAMDSKELSSISDCFGDQKAIK